MRMHSPPLQTEHPCPAEEGLLLTAVAELQGAKGISPQPSLLPNLSEKTGAVSLHPPEQLPSWQDFSRRGKPPH